MEEKIAKILNYIDKNASEGLKVQELATHFSYSKFHFSREFKKITVVIPNEYISSIKIHKSIHLILNGESVTHSQLESRYSSAGTFSTTFSKNTGLSPREYSKKAYELVDIVKKQEAIVEDYDHLFYRNPNYETYISPYKLTVHLDVPEQFKGVVFSGLFLKPNPNHKPLMGRCRVKNYCYEFYHLPPGTSSPLACGIQKSKNPFKYFQLETAMRACDGQRITFPLTQNKTLTIKLRKKEISDPPIIINLPNILASAIQQQMKRNQQKIMNKIKK